MTSSEIYKGVERAVGTTSSRYPFLRLEVGDALKFVKRSTAKLLQSAPTSATPPRVFEAGLGLDGEPYVWRTA